MRQSLGIKPEKILDQRTLQIENTQNGKTENLESLKVRIRPNSANSTAKSVTTASIKDGYGGNPKRTYSRVQSAQSQNTIVRLLQKDSVLSGVDQTKLLQQLNLPTKD